MNPVECLEKQLEVWKGALRSSAKSCQMGVITTELHQTHKNNIEPKIKEYKLAIEILIKNNVK